MKTKQRVISVLRVIFLTTAIFCKGEGADLIQNEITPERVNALLTRIVNVEKQMQDNVRSHPNVSRVIILGNTGSGKSTLVHALGRRPLKVEEEGSDLFIQVEERHRIPEFIVRRGIEGGTQQPTSWFDPSTNLVFWDCPGFMDPSGVSRDIETLFAVERLFTPPCNIKILLTIDKNAQQADRGQSIMKRLKNLRSFFTEEEQLQRAVSIVVTKQRPLRNGRGFPEPSTVFEEMGLFGIEPDAERTRNLATATGITSQELEWISSFLGYLRDNNRIFAFPEPLDAGSYNYDWFPSREIAITDLTSQPISNPTVNIFANFAMDASTLLIMERAAGRLTLAVDKLQEFFRYVRRSVPLTRNSLEAAKGVIKELNDLDIDFVNTPAKLAEQLRQRLNRLSISGENNTQCIRILDDLSASQAYLSLIDKLDTGRRGQIWQTGVPNIPATLRRLASGSLTDLQNALSNMGSSGKGEDSKRTLDDARS